MMFDQFREAIQRKVDHPGDYIGSNRMELKLHRCDHSEIPTAAAKAPQQIRVLCFARSDQIAVSGNDLGRLEIVAAETDFAMEPAKAATKRETGDTGHRYDRPGTSETESLCHLVKMRPRQAGLCNSNPLPRVDF